MDIFNRPPTISEDTVQYVLYPSAAQADKASATTLAVLMQNHAAALLPDMQWHRDAFQLKVVPHPRGAGCVLEGRMRVGDSIDDEWAAVWLLREITARWDAAVRVFDTDGEFLLIEAADCLPSWVTPSNAENRVWIYGSHLHIVSIEHVSSSTNGVKRRGYPGIRDNDEQDPLDDDSGYITEQHAVDLVRDPSVDTQASSQIEEAVWQRIAGYPARARSHIHYAKAHIPVDVAKALRANPSLVQKAVETFYTRDAIQLRAAHRMSRFPPEPSVETTVRLTRTAYAQLVGQKFYPPKIFGRWTEPEESPEYKAKDLGMKIACGFEMLYQESKSRKVPSEAISSEARKEALKQNSDYRTFIKNLESVGFFKGNLEGSQAWNELEDKAVEAFLEARRDDDALRPSFAALVDSAIAKTGSSPPVLEITPDPDDWLHIDADSFDAMLKQASQTADQGGAAASGAQGGDAATQQEDEFNKEQTSRLRSLAQKVEEFVEGKGDLEGAVFSDEEMSEDESGEESAEDSDDEEMNMNVDTPPEEDPVRQAAMDKLVPGLEPSEYGQMPPSFYRNSQRVAPASMESEGREDAPTDGSSASTRPIRAPILPRDKYEGVDSDDETDEEGDADDESEEEKPQVDGEIEIDMDQEQEEFLEFARQALGISEAQWQEIVQERENKGAFVPERKPVGDAAQMRASPPLAAPGEPPREPRGPAARPPTKNPDLDSFESLMQAMDAELAKSRSRHLSPTTAKADPKGKAKAQPTETGGDIEAAMEAELQAALDRGPQDEDELELGDGSQHGEYNLIKNFLESFKSQAGLSGPVGNLAGRLQPGWQIPRDEA